MGTGTTARPSTRSFWPIWTLLWRPPWLILVPLSLASGCRCLLLPLREGIGLRKRRHKRRRASPPLSSLRWFHRVRRVRIRLVLFPAVLILTTQILLLNASMVAAPTTRRIACPPPLTTLSRNSSASANSRHRF